MRKKMETMSAGRVLASTASDPHCDASFYLQTSTSSLRATHCFLLAVNELKLHRVHKLDR